MDSLQQEALSTSLPLDYKKLTNEYTGSINPNFLFLDRTLVKKGMKFEKSGVSYFSYRRWRSDVKALQLSSFQDLKRSPDKASAEYVAAQLSDFAKSIINGCGFEFVAPVPSGSSEREYNFASILASFVAFYLGIPSKNMLEGKIIGRRSNSSHPRQSIRFQARLRNLEKGTGVVLLIDDVASTGTHFARCADQLKQLGYSVVCVAWVG